MAYYLNPGAVVGLLSGLALAALGLIVLRVRPRTPATLAFSTFALLWGLSSATANVAQLALDPPTALPWAHVFVALQIPLYAPLLYFVSAHPWPSNPLARRPAALALLAAPAALLLLLDAAAPALFVAGVGVNPRDGLPLTQFGPLFQPVQLLNLVGAFVAALAITTRNLVRATGESAREQLGLLATAFLLYLSYRSADLVNLLVVDRDFLFALLGPGAFALRVGVMAAALAAVGYVVALAARRRDLPWRDLLLAGGVVPFAVGALESVAGAAGVVGFSTVGFWRLAMVGLFAYAIARYRLFDVEVRLSGLAPVAAYGAAAAVGSLALWGLAGGLLARAPLLAGLAVLGMAAACAPAVRLGSRALRRAAPQVADPEYLYKRKVDVYRAALEEAAAKGAGERTEQVFLSELRRNLGISEQEHKLLLLFLKSQEKFGRPLHAAAGDRFKVERELGRGTFGRAVLAHDTLLDRRVVLKQPIAAWLVDTEGRQRFLQEARLAARIQHPNVVAVHEVMPDEEPPMLVLEYVPGGSLESLLRQRGRLSEEQAAQVAIDVLAGLERIHKAGIVHRDLKPANILLDQEGVAKVTDFGIAHPPKELAGAPTLATAQQQPGSVAYMSPEQARGDQVDERSDLYAVGVVLHQMLTGRHYLLAKGISESQLRRLIQEAPLLLPAEGVPPGLEPVLWKALAKDPAQRYPSAAEMAKALRAAMPRAMGSTTARA